MLLLLLSPQTILAQAEITNVGIDASLGFVLESGFVALRTSELRSNNMDLNGDGDATDFVLHLYNTGNDVLTNTGLEASGAFATSGSAVLWSVFEARQGLTDLNGDGDTNDFVVHVADASTGTTTNLGVAATAYTVVGNVAAIMVIESLQGMTDLNGDGDASDTVLHLLDVSSGTLTNVGVDTNGGFVVDGSRVLFGVSEINEGSDLNGDGDIADIVLHARQGGTTTNLGVSSSQFDFQLEGDVAAFVVMESFEGGTDLNGDLDANDGVLHMHDFGSGTTTNLGLAVDMGSTDFQLAGGLVAVEVSETQQGVDLNADLDAIDEVLHLVDTSDGTITNLAFAIEGLQLNESGYLAFAVREFRQGFTDLNADGDSNDLVLHLMNTGTGTVQNLLTDATLGFKLDGDMLLGFGAEEANQGGADGNGDGDTGDFTLYVFDIATGTLINLAVDPSGGFQTFQLDTKFVSFGVNEEYQGAMDLNGDSDADDVVLHYYDVETGVTVNLMADVSLGHQLENGKIAYAVTEASQGMTDLNGDGDALDVVLHVAELEPANDSPKQMIEALIAHVQSLGLPRKVERSRVLMLRHALRALEKDKPCKAIKFVRVFKFSVRAGAGKRIPRADANALMAEAQAIIDVLKAEHPECARHHHRDHGKGRGHDKDRHHDEGRGRGNGHGHDRHRHHR